MALAGAQGVGHRPAGALAQPGVQRGERLVEQHHRGRRREGPGQRHPLLLAAGELVRQPGAHRERQPHQVEQLRDAGALAAGAARHAEGDVARDVQVREQRALLRHVADPAALRRHGPARAGTPPGRRTRSCRRPGRGSPAMSRSRVVLPQPDGPRMAVSSRAGTSRSTPCSTVVAPEGLGDTTQREGGHAVVDLRASRVSRNVAGQRDQDDQRGVGRSRTIGDAGAVAPELGGQGLRADRREQQRRGQLGGHGEEHQRRPGAEARAR